jgi:hypothetical protein
MCKCGCNHTYEYLRQISIFDLYKKRKQYMNLLEDKKQNMPWMIESWQEGLDKVNAEITRRAKIEQD